MPFFGIVQFFYHANQFFKYGTVMASKSNVVISSPVYDKFGLSQAGSSRLQVEVQVYYSVWNIHKQIKSKIKINFI